jgi:hypothetical protein
VFLGANFVKSAHLMARQKMVIPAQARIQHLQINRKDWIPIFMEITKEDLRISSRASIMES